MKLQYGTANVGFNAAWVMADQVSPVGKPVPAAVKEDLKALNSAYTLRQSSQFK